MDDLVICHCGHIWDEHGHDPKLRNYTGCNVEGCYCISFEENADAPADDVCDQQADKTDTLGHLPPYFRVK